MFDPEDDFTQEKFTINKAFAAKFDKKKEREFLDQSKQKYGKDLESKHTCTCLNTNALAQ